MTARSSENTRPFRNIFAQTLTRQSQILVLVPKSFCPSIIDDLSPDGHGCNPQPCVEKQSSKEADADIGEYKVLAKIVEDEGFAVDAPGAFNRAQSTASKCAQLGGKWVHFDVMRNEPTFLQRAKTAQSHFRACVESVHDRRP